MLTLICLNFVAMVMFSLAMNKHWQQVMVDIPQKLPAKALRLSAWLMMLVAVYFAISLYGWTIGLAVFVGTLTAALLPLILLLSFRAQSIRFLAPLALLLALLGYCINLI